VKNDEPGDESSYIIVLWSPRENVLSDSEKPKALPATMEIYFQPVADPSVPTVILNVDVGHRSYVQTPASEPKLTIPDEVHEGISGLKVGKAPGPNGIQNIALKYVPHPAVSLLVRTSKQFSSPITSLEEARSSDVYT
jgi:hypothetical protein